MRVLEGGDEGWVGRSAVVVAGVGEAEGGAMSGVVEGLLAAAEGVMEEAVDVDVRGLVLALASERTLAEAASAA